VVLLLESDAVPLLLLLVMLLLLLLETRACLRASLIWS
jgi:hypothetical protein